MSVDPQLNRVFQPDGPSFRRTVSTITSTVRTGIMSITEPIRKPESRPKTILQRMVYKLDPGFRRDDAIEQKGSRIIDGNESITEKFRLMTCAREAALKWAQTPLPIRLATMKRLRSIIVERQHDIVELVHTSTGKPRSEVLLSELFPTLDLIRHYEKYAESYLASSTSTNRLAFPGSTFRSEYHPLGVVLVLSPWNFPFQLSMIPVVTALIAGNAVILKPSELVPDVGDLMNKLFQALSLPRNLVTIIQGGPEAGQALIQAGPDFVFLTGDTRTGKKVMSQCAEQMIPMLLELGGKDPMIVFDDAPFERSVQGAIYGAFSNSGQVCVSVERLYVQKGIADVFESAVAKAAKTLRAGRSEESDMGPLISQARIDKIKTQLDDALSKGARLLTPLQFEGTLMSPVVLSNAHHDMLIMQEETFGPVLPIMRFESEDEVIQRANQSTLGLSASVWTRDLTKGTRVASRLVAGNVGINEVIKNIGNPKLPFGGVKQSGFGRYRGPDGLRSLSRQMTIVTNTAQQTRELNWFPYSDELQRHLQIFLKLIFGSREQRPPWTTIFNTLRYFRRRLRS